MFVLQALLAFIVTIGILVTVHEFGHYWVAKKSGVKILCFSIGFGKPLFQRRFGEDRTEFVIAAIPLGGYVKMLDEGEAPVAKEEQHRAFNRKSLAVRSAIVFAGPLFNFLFAIFAYTVMFMMGITGVKPVIGDITADSIAAKAGLPSEYAVVAVNDVKTPHWSHVIEATISRRLSHNDVTYHLEHQNGYVKTVTLDLAPVSVDDLAQEGFFKKLGFMPFRIKIPAQIERVLPDSPASRAGLLANDEIIQMDDTPVNDWFALADYISSHPNKLINVTVKRGAGEATVQLTPENKDGVGRIGVQAKQANLPEGYINVERYGLGTALWKGVEKTWDTSLLTLRMLYKMLTFQVSFKNISGPITTAEYAGHSVARGAVTFILFLGLVSVSLGVINLLPIPVLDGGHLFLYALEALKGSPLTDNTIVIFQRIGLTMVLSLMGLALFNDLERLLS